MGVGEHEMCKRMCSCSCSLYLAESSTGRRLFQSHYSLLGRECEHEAFQVCKNEGLGVLPWGALRG